MAITIKGVRINSISITRKEEDGASEITASYALMSSDDRVLAKQSVGGYSDIKVQPSPNTLKLFREATDAYRADLNAVLGLE